MEGFPELEEELLQVEDTGLDVSEDEDAEAGRELVAKFLEGDLDLSFVEEKSRSTVPPSSNKKPLKQSQTASGSIGKVRIRNVRKLPPALKCLMGEANLRYARGDKETAMKICLEIIRQVPSAPEPFHTLAGLYEETGDRENSLLMSLIAAHLGPTDVYTWVHLAEVSEELGKYQQASCCITKAIRTDIANLELHRKREKLLEKAGDRGGAIRNHMQLLETMSADKGETIVALAKMAAELCHKNKDTEKACQALELAVTKCPSNVGLDTVNLHLELLIQLEKFKRCLEVMVEFCDMVFEAESTRDESSGVETLKVTDCFFPESTPADILAKLAVVLIKMGAMDLVERVTGPLLEMDTCEAGELYMDIAEAYAECGHDEEACVLYCQLVDSEAYSLPGVWLKYGESLKRLGRLEEAVDAYYSVLETARRHTDVRLQLASILTQLGRQEEAVTVLCQLEDEVVDPGLLYERCRLLLHDSKRREDLFTMSRLLFLRHSMQLRTLEEIHAISTNFRYERKRSLVRGLRQTKSECTSEEPPFIKGPNDPSPEDEWTLFLDICQIWYETKRYDRLHFLAVVAQLSVLFNPAHQGEIKLLNTLAAHLNKEKHTAFNFVRNVAIKNLDKPMLWQFFNQIINTAEDTRHSKYLMRVLAKNSNNVWLGLLHGNNCLMSGTLKYALHEYTICCKRDGSPLSHLLLGLTYLFMAVQKSTYKKHRLVTQAISFFNEYRKKRGKAGEQEAYYNMGRALHHLGLLPSAVYYYKLALDTPCHPDLDSEIFDVKREAAYNLHIIYLQAENYQLARMYLDKYVVV